MTVSHDTDLINEIKGLVEKADERAGEWLRFTTDRPVELQAAINWYIRNDKSPFNHENKTGRKRNFYVQWETRDGKWTRGFLKGLKEGKILRNAEQTGRMRMCRIQKGRP